MKLARNLQKLLAFEEPHSGSAFEGTCDQRSTFLEERLESSFDASVPNPFVAGIGDQVAFQRYISGSSATGHFIEVVAGSPVPNALVLARHEEADIQDAVEALWPETVAT